MYIDARARARDGVREFASLRPVPVNGPSSDGGGGGDMYARMCAMPSYR